MTSEEERIFFAFELLESTQVDSISKEIAPQRINEEVSPGRVVSFQVKIYKM